jgi:antitoxin ParD1/3/4
MNVSLTPALEKLIKKKVKSGAYNNASEVVREALRLLEEQDKERELKIQHLRMELQKGIEQLDRKEYGNSSLERIAKSIRKK